MTAWGYSEEIPSAGDEIILELVSVDICTTLGVCLKATELYAYVMIIVRRSPQSLLGSKVGHLESDWIMEVLYLSEY